MATVLRKQELTGTIDMQIQASQHNSNETAAINAAPSDTQLIQTLFTVEQFTHAEPAFTTASLRNLIFKAEPRYSSKCWIPGNGLIECGAIVRVGRKVLIDGEKFLVWVRQQNGSSQ